MYTNQYYHNTGSSHYYPFYQNHTPSSEEAVHYSNQGTTGESHPAGSEDPSYTQIDSQYSSHPQYVDPYEYGYYPHPTCDQYGTPIASDTEYGGYYVDPYTGYYAPPIPASTYDFSIPPDSEQHVYYSETTYGHHIPLREEKTQSRAAQQHFHSAHFPHQGMHESNPELASNPLKGEHIKASIETLNSNFRKHKTMKHPQPVKAELTSDLARISHKTQKKSGKMSAEIHRDCIREHDQGDKAKEVRDEDCKAGCSNFSRASEKSGLVHRKVVALSTKEERHVPDTQPLNQSPIDLMLNEDLVGEAMRTPQAIIDQEKVALAVKIFFNPVESSPTKKTRNSFDHQKILDRFITKVEENSPYTTARYLKMEEDYARASSPNYQQWQDVAFHFPPEKMLRSLNSIRSIFTIYEFPNSRKKFPRYLFPCSIEISQEKQQLYRLERRMKELKDNKSNMVLEVTLTPSGTINHCFLRQMKKDEAYLEKNFESSVDDLKEIQFDSNYPSLSTLSPVKNQNGTVTLPETHLEFQSPYGIKIKAPLKS